MVRPHRQHDVRLGDEVAREQLRAVIAQVEPVLHPDEQRAVRRRRALPGARPRARDLDVGESALDRDLVGDRFGERAATGVAGADEQNLHIHDICVVSRCRRHQASPTRSGTLSRRISALIAPGRITRGRRPVQSTTGEGADGARRPPSSASSVPRAITDFHCETISPTDVAGGTPGLFALVEVSGWPYARSSRVSPGCGVHRTATPPSGPRSRAGTRRSPPERTRVSGPGQWRAARRAAYAGSVRPNRSIIVLPATRRRKGFPAGRPLSATRASTPASSAAPPKPYTVSVG